MHVHITHAGTVYVFVAIATLAGTPTAGALLKVPDQRHFETLILFTGGLLALGTVVLVGAAVAGNVGLREKLCLGSRRGSEDPESCPVTTKSPTLHSFQSHNGSDERNLL